MAGQGASSSRPAAVALRAGGEAARVPGVAEEVGGGADLRVSGTGEAVGEGLREAAGDRDRDDPLGHEPHHAAQARQRGPLKCFKKAWKSGFEAYCKTVSSFPCGASGCGCCVALSRSSV